MAQKKVRQVAQAAKMPTSKAAHAKAGVKKLSSRIKTGPTPKLKLGGKPGAKLGSAPKTPKSKKVSAKMPKMPAAFAGKGKKQAAPPFPGAAPPLM